MKVRPSAMILNGESVLTLRYNYGNVNVYALPGGNPDPGENLTEALMRELTEELEIETKIGPMVFCGEVIWDEIKKETLHIIFATEITSGIPKVNAAETTALELVWLPFSELSHTILYPNVGKYLLSYIQGKPEPAHVGVIDQPYIQ
ncbi:NUDIX domain-containing protein [Dyadobacter sp. CY312]|uniref:NUDIX domain-containing protein n=1 Tax=Dyadobacter sp. CY312 TaxID=2907303 RepID=UPI001F1C7C3E|nr:NUDIX domain-containing protein [Dyadobacter sp. CY312]MCE7042067.1 NUDIX domain-containing protein [Dyadobacter sp. CY312]